MHDTRHFVVRTLLAEGLVREADVRRATEHAVSAGCDVLDALVSLNIVSSRRLAIARAKICEYPFVDLSHFEIDFRNTRALARAAAERLCAFPLFIVGGVATVAMLDPLNLQAVDQLRQLIKAEIDPVLAEPEHIRSLIGRAYSLARPEGEQLQDLGEEGLTTGDEPIVAAVNQILSGAAEMGASDIHINPDEQDLRLRYRVDGVLQGQQGPPRSAHAGIVQRLKVLAKLDLTQTRKPQDGKFRFQHKTEAVDVRLSLVPTIHGENVVMRLLRSAARIGEIKDLGMPEAMSQAFGELIEKPHGMFLVTGPTGSGKTTTLYTAIAHLNDPSRNIMTIEDPVEIRLPLVRQIQVNAEVGLTFATALRSILRQDPDVVLVGEIRDQETAKIAVQSALTGHLVFSTLHTNDAVGAVARLRDFALPNFAINSALLAVIAQRLVRRLCPACSKPEEPGAIHVAIGELPIPPAATFRRPGGCPRCMNTGYKGRLGAFEMLQATHRVRELIEQDAPAARIAEAARADGMTSLWEDGLRKAALGQTSLDEVASLRAGIDDAETSPERMAA